MNSQTRPDSVTLHQQARAYRSQLVGELLARLLRAVARMPDALRKPPLTGRKRHAILDA